jgi:hypothetical protein
VNREITALIGLLNLAAENGLLEKIPATRRLKNSEEHLARERVLKADNSKRSSMPLRDGSSESLSVPMRPV